MLALLSKIDQVFKWSNSGRIVVPGIPVAIKDCCRIKVGDKIELRLPDGKVINTKISGLNMLCGTPTPPPVPILLPQELSKEDLPLGTEIWIDEDKLNK